jgi:Antibiotic biosynthesis monooxygenase
VIEHAMILSKDKSLRVHLPRPGALETDATQDLQDRERRHIEEMWRNEEQLERHLRSDEYQKVILVLEMALKQPEIRFDTISSSMGLEALEKARNHESTG